MRKKADACEAAMARSIADLEAMLIVFWKVYEVESLYKSRRRAQHLVEGTDSTPGAVKNDKGQGSWVGVRMAMWWKRR